jgi:gluconokinase
MGVSGCGKSTVGQLLARRLGVHYVEGDDMHPAQNVQRMAAGIPLTDADRHEWLQEVAGQLANASTEARGVVVSCSALKRHYRDQLRAGAPDVRFVHLHGPRELLARRVAARQHAYMPASLLDSQLATLEPPGPDERPITLDVASPPDQLAAEAERLLRETSS